ncbi:MAG: hypothetical protein ACLS3J_14815, partial [Segatella copri]
QPECRHRCLWRRFRPFQGRQEDRFAEEEIVLDRKSPIGERYSFLSGFNYCVSFKRFLKA